MKQERLYDLDWLRVLAFICLMGYHAGMVFVGWDFHLMNEQKLTVLKPVMVFLNQWRLPLLFAISGAGTWFAIGRRSVAGFAAERSKRLLLPLIFGMFFIIPPQIYVEYLAKGRIAPGYWDFQRTVFQMVPYPEGGAFSWHHLWFVVYLYVFVLVSIPCLFFLRRARGAALLQKLRDRLSRRSVFLLLSALPLILINVGMNWAWPETHGLIDDPAALLRYLLLFWLGLIVMASPEIRKKVRQERAFFLFASAAAFVGQRILVAQLTQSDVFNYVTYHTLGSCYCWFAILTILGYASRYLTRGSRLLTYANEAVYPFYILHQSVMMVITYLVLPYGWNPWVKFCIILLGMFAITALLYELVIRRLSLLRPLFGMKAKPAKPTSSADTAVAAPVGIA